MLTRTLGRPKNRWEDDIRNDLKKLKMKNWTSCIQDRNNWKLYRVIHKSLWDFRPLRYSSRDGHAEGEHVNRGRDTPSFCPTLQVLGMLTSEGS